VGILEKTSNAAVIDTFLMSCRVMNRGVEQALMAYLLEQARSLDCTSLVGEYLPTERNGMVKEFYPKLGFEVQRETATGVGFFLDLESRAVEWPKLIARVE
jgi:predicted enzyme involved in methoxymalonyl-ACP biosynthesis